MNKFFNPSLKSFSFKWRDAFTADKSLHSTTKLVLHTLHLYMGNRNGKCFPSIQTIAELSSLDPRTVSPHIKKAEKARYLTITKRGSTSGWRRNNYQANIPLMDEHLITGREEDIVNREENKVRMVGINIPTNSFSNSVNNSTNNSFIKNHHYEELSEYQKDRLLEQEQDKKKITFIKDIPFI